MHGRSSARRPASTRRAKRPSSPSASFPRVARTYFGTDGVRGVVGEFLTADLVERLGRASALWKGGGRIFVGSDTSASGDELEDALARGDDAAGSVAVLDGDVQSTAGALIRLDLG